MLAEDSKFHERLQAMIRTLTSNPHERDDMFQEAIKFLLKEEPKLAKESHTESWYVHRCRRYLRDQNKMGRSVDAPKRRHLACPVDDTANGPDSPAEGLIAKESVLAAVSAADLVSEVSAHLPPVECYVLDALNKGYSEGEIAQKLGVTRQAVAKYRKKIAAQLDLAA